jgi:hypothetical protein
MSTQNNKQVKHFLDSIVEGDITSDVENTEENSNLITDELTDEEKETLELERLELENNDNLETDEENIDNFDYDYEEVKEFTYAPFAQELVDSEILIIPEEGEHYDDSLDGFKEMVDDTVRFRIDEYKASFTNPTTAKFIEFLENGGSPDEFIDKSSQLPDYANLDITDLDTQKNLIRDSLTLQGHEDDEIEEAINSFEEINSLEKNAKLAQRRLVKYADERLAQIANEQKAKEQEKQERLNSELYNLKKVIFDSTDIAGFKPTKTEREKFYEYMTKPVKDSKGNVATKYLIDMQEEDKVKMAYYKFRNFSFSDIESKIETKKANDLQKMLKLKGDKINSRNSTLPEEEITTNKLPSLPWLSL